MNLDSKVSGESNFLTWFLFHRVLEERGMVASIALISWGRKPVSLLVSLGIWRGELGSSVIMSFAVVALTDMGKI